MLPLATLTMHTVSVGINVVDDFSSLTACLLVINNWMNNNSLKLNEDKTEILLVGPKTKRDELLKQLHNLTPLIKKEVASFGVSLDLALCPI